MIKHVFIIAGTMMVSSLLFSVMFGDTGRSFMWKSLEPIFQDNWEMNSYNDGVWITEQLNRTFEATEEIHSINESNKVPEGSNGDDEYYEEIEDTVVDEDNPADAPPIPYEPEEPDEPEDIVDDGSDDNIIEPINPGESKH